jgi:hypothetical protein
MPCGKLGRIGGGTGRIPGRVQCRHGLSRVRYAWKNRLVVNSRSSDRCTRGGDSRTSRLSGTGPFIVDIVSLDIISPSTSLSTDPSWWVGCSALRFGEDMVSVAPLLYLCLGQGALWDRTSDLIARWEEFQAVFGFHVVGCVAPRVFDAVVDH